MEGKLDFNSASHMSDRINFLVDAAINLEKETPRDYLGASIVGHQCERHVQYYWHNLLNGITPTFPPRIRRIFDRGNVYEDKARRWLASAGFVFSPLKHGFSDGRFAGNVDGVIINYVGAESPVALPVLWECKCLKDKSWKEMVKGGLRNYSSTTYWAQVHVYMHYLELPSCLFTSVNADTMELHHEVVPFNSTEAGIYIARAKRIINAVEMVPRCTRDRNLFTCKWCDYRERCWDEN